MAKKDHDSTMDLSLSQLVVPKPPKAPPRGMNPNDVSVWGQLVVGQADFAPMPKKRAAHAPLWIGLGVVGTLAIAAAVYIMFMRPSHEPQAAAAATPAAESTKSNPDSARPDPAKAAAATQPATKGVEAPAAKAAEPAPPGDPQQMLATAEPVLGSIRGLVAAMRSSFVAVSALDRKKLNAKTPPPVKKKIAPKPARRRR
jgi:predicted lipid-binding transport protein (Tim44 family)